MDANLLIVNQQLNEANDFGAYDDSLHDYQLNAIFNEEDTHDEGNGD